LHYQTGLSDYSNEEKEAFAFHTLCSFLAKSRYHVATPVPDLGDDLWIRSRHPPSRVIRVQMKSSFHWVQRTNTETRRYAVNIATRSLDDDCADDKLYAVPLFENGNDLEFGFHFGFIPSTFLATPPIRGHLCVPKGTKRVVLHVDRTRIHGKFDYRLYMKRPEMEQGMGADLNCYFGLPGLQNFHSGESLHPNVVAWRTLAKLGSNGH